MNPVIYFFNLILSNILIVLFKNEEIVILNGKDTTYNAFSKTGKKSIEGRLAVFHNDIWNEFLYLQFKDVLKICSFFYFNSGTLLIHKNLKIINRKRNFILKNYATIECLENATDFQSCKFKEELLVIKFF